MNVLEEIYENTDIQKAEFEQT